MHLLEAVATIHVPTCRSRRVFPPPLAPRPQRWVLLRRCWSSCGTSATLIPVSAMVIGPIFKRDVMRAALMRKKKKPEFATILAFDVPIDPEARAMVLGQPLSASLSPSYHIVVVPPHVLGLLFFLARACIFLFFDIAL